MSATAQPSPSQSEPCIDMGRVRDAVARIFGRDDRPRPMFRIHRTGPPMQPVDAIRRHYVRGMGRTCHGGTDYFTSQFSGGKWKG